VRGDPAEGPRGRCGSSAALHASTTLL
jgi:hypothetical protein